MASNPTRTRSSDSSGHLAHAAERQWATEEQLVRYATMAIEEYRVRRGRATGVGDRATATIIERGDPAASHEWGWCEPGPGSHHPRHPHPEEGVTTRRWYW